MPRVCVLDLGRLECDRAWHVAVPSPSTVSHPAPERERMLLPVIAALVESRGRLILFDTGCHPDAMRGRWTATWADYFAYSASPEQKLEAQLSLPDYVGPYVSQDWLVPGTNWQFTGDLSALTSEVRLVRLAGHTPGTLGMQVEGGSRTVIFPSDAMYAAENLGPPLHPAGVVYDSAGFRQTAEWLTFMRDSAGALIVYPHDPAQFSSLATAPDWFEE